MSNYQKYYSGFWVRAHSIYNYRSDLHPKSSKNVLFKYADDNTLIVPETTDVSVPEEFEHKLMGYCS